MPNNLKIHPLQKGSAAPHHPMLKDKALNPELVDL
jgi:hypothetical protein